MNKPLSDVDSARQARRDGLVGLSVMAALPAIAGLSVLAAAGDDLAHASPVLMGIGALLLGSALVMLTFLVKAAAPNS
jgi:hypothetical protein